MKKRLFVTICAIIAVVVLATACFVGCKEPADGGNKDNDANKVTVSWYYGTTLLKEEKIEKGSLATKWEPTIEGKTFMNWYSEASNTILFDFTKPVVENVDIFAGFRSDAFTKDESVWCAIGTGAGTLKGSNWSETAEVEELFKLTRLDEANVNKFVIELTLYEGDQFQIRNMGTWTGQHGVGYLDGYTELAEAEGDILAVVNDAEGNRVFHAIKGFGDSPKGWNAIVDASGIYKITLQTYPDNADYDVIYWEKIGEAPVLDITHEMYVLGTMNAFTPDDAGKMATDSMREDFSLIINITEDMYGDWTITDANNPFGTLCAAIKVKNDVSGTWYGVSSQTAGEDGKWTLTAAGNDNLFLLAGQYKVEYNVTKDEVVVTPVEKGYFLAGRLAGEDSWTCSSNYKFEKVSDTEYEIYYTVTEDDYQEYMGENAGAVKATFGYSDTTPDFWFGNQEDGENLLLPSTGLYRIVLTIEEVDGEVKGYVTATKLGGYYLVGTLKDGDTWRAEVGFEMSQDGDDYVIEYTFTEKDSATWCAPDVAAVKVLFVDEDGKLVWYGDASEGNVMIASLGKYKITLSEGVVSAVAVAE